MLPTDVVSCVRGAAIWPSADLTQRQTLCAWHRSPVAGQQPSDPSFWYSVSVLRGIRAGWRIQHSWDCRNTLRSIFEAVFPVVCCSRRCVPVLGHNLLHAAVQHVCHCDASELAVCRAVSQPPSP